jgi:hypothetical protein
LAQKTKRLDTTIKVLYDKLEVYFLNRLLCMSYIFDSKKLFLIGLAALLLVGIPVTVYLLQKQQELASHAQKSTNLSFSPTSSSQAPLVHNIGDNIPLTVNVDPGQNLVSFVKLDIQYDPTILATISGQPAFTPNTQSFPSVLEGPIYSSGKIEITLSVGPDPTKAIQALTTAGTVTLHAIADTPAGQPTQVTYAVDTEVMSIGPNDEASENVLSTATPATIVIGAGTNTPTSPQSIPTATPTPTIAVSGVVSAAPTPVISSAPTATPTPTPATSGAPTATPTPVPGTTSTPTLTPTPMGSTSASNSAPTCTALLTDRSPTGTPPFSLTLTAQGNGNPSSVNINSVTFNFGDGGVTTVTTGGGIGGNSVNVPISHTYNNTGNFTATATLTDSNGLTGTSQACTQTVTVNTASGGTGSSGSTVIAQNPTSSIPTPTMRATGSTSETISVAAIALTFIIGGAFLFFAL